ncbi:MuDR family transposase [Striga hermonthica]|uniref:MuDR family transposase n=1 Tax=Striga hermonthica TaxID=68872 RepID=A0A9N7R1J4_STRHE|nr:MuDR family transposase [Striga hermonthica]
MRRDQMMKYDGVICPKIMKLLEELKKRSMECIANWNVMHEFEVDGPYGSKFRVHLGERTCSCRKWELTGIPCEHAISGLFFLGHDPEEYVDSWYKKETFLKAYSSMMGALNSPDEWPKVDVQPLQPPLQSKMPGRPKKYNRKRGPDEVQEKGKQKKKVEVKLSKKGTTLKCSLCHKENHNMRGCPFKKEDNPHTVEANNKAKKMKTSRKTSDGNCRQSQESVVYHAQGSQSSDLQVKKPTVGQVNNQKKTLWKPPGVFQGATFSTQKGRSSVNQNVDGKKKVKADVVFCFIDDSVLIVKYVVLG